MPDDERSRIVQELKDMMNHPSFELLERELAKRITDAALALIVTLNDPSCSIDVARECLKIVKRSYEEFCKTAQIVQRQMN